MTRHQLNNGTTRAIFSSAETTPELNDKLEIWVKGLLIEEIVSLKRLMEILSKLVPYPERKVLQILTTSCLKISGPHRAASKSILHSFLPLQASS